MPTELSDPNKIKKLKRDILNFFADDEQRKSKINKAIKFAGLLAQNIKRRNGDPEITHSLMVALKTAEMGLGTNSVCAALLHNILEHNPENSKIDQQIKKDFGQDVYDLVNGLTKISVRMPTSDHYTEIEAAQKYLIATINDLRVIMIKLADKLHNVYTIDGLRPDEQKIYLDRVKYLYVPIAKYLGLNQIYDEIKDLLLLKTNPEEYKTIQKFLKENIPAREKDCSLIVDELKTICDLESVKAEVKGRYKSISSIHQKKKKYMDEGKNPPLKFIRDVLAFRIIPQTQTDCLKISSATQKFYELVPGSFKDYITKPKKNGYQSIHSVYRHPDHGVFELQIRTQKMHDHCEYGPASHIAYKFQGKRNVNPTDEYSWIKKLKATNQQNTEDKPIPVKLFENQIFVLTPESEVIQLPKGSTPVDLAYRIHTDLGNQCVGAEVNKRPVALDHTLNTGDIVKISSNPKKKYPGRSWLKFVKTEKAQRRIKQALNRARL